MLLSTAPAIFAVLFVCDAVPTNYEDNSEQGVDQSVWDLVDFNTKLEVPNETVYRLKRGSGTKVGGAAASAKTATKNSGGSKKNLRPEDFEALSPFDVASSDLEAAYRRKRGSGTKVGGAAASTKTATKNSGGSKKNLRPEDFESLSPVDVASSDLEASYRRKRGSGTKVGGAAASAKTATKNSGGSKKNFRPEDFEGALRETR